MFLHHSPPNIDAERPQSAVVSNRHSRRIAELKVNRLRTAQPIRFVYGTSILSTTLRTPGTFEASWTAFRRASRVARCPERVTTPFELSTSIPVRLSDSRFFFTSAVVATLSSGAGVARFQFEQPASTAVIASVR